MIHYQVIKHDDVLHKPKGGNGRDLAQSYDKHKIKKTKLTTQIKTSITQRLRTDDLGWSVWEATATQLVRLNQLTGPQPSH